MWLRRDQLSGKPLQTEDQQLTNRKYEKRKINHRPSESSKAKAPDLDTKTEVGQLVCLVGETDKLQP